MNRIQFLIVLLLSQASNVPSLSANDLTTGFATKMKPLLQTYCRDCHGADVHKSGLNLSELKLDFQKEAVLAPWVRIYDKLVAGEMPPKDAPQPDRASVEAATTWLKKELQAASFARQQKKGRVVLRRLNGTEYETTIRDLLGVNVNVKETLPDDNSAAGFDNVAAVLDVSATHQLSYQEAAEKAILATIPSQPPMPFSDKRTGKEISTKGPNFQQALTRSCKLDGDALILYSKLPRYGLCQTAAVKMAGRYRVTMSIGAVGAEQRAVPAAFMTIGRGREDAVPFEFRDIPAGPPQIVEAEVDLPKDHAFVVNMLSIWDIRAFKKPIDEYTGPGLAVEWMKIEGPVGDFPPASYARTFSGVPLKAKSVATAEAEGKKVPVIPENRSEYSWNADPLVPASAQPQEDAERLIRDFLPRAFRRPVSETLQQHFVRRVHDKLDEKYSFVDAMVYGYKAILTSPHFLLFNEPGSAEVNNEADLASPRLDDFALANRLSYFIWSTYPDEELLRIAHKKELTKPDVLRAQVERMLNSPKAERFTENFTGQWLELRKIAATIPDPHLYCDFDGVLLWAMPRETRAFFDEVLRHDLSLLEFVDSDWSMLNERLAAHYGIPGVFGNELRKVKLPPGSHRGGVMTHASVLKVTADGTRTSPVLRGKWVLEQIVGKPPAPPPSDIPPIEPDIRGATTIREQLDKHRNVAACATCHNHIDPPGFALENFDPIGGWRDFYRATTRTKAGQIQLANYAMTRPIYRGPDVEKGGQAEDGRSFADIDEFKQLMLSDKDQLARNLTQKLVVYATGADIQFADREVVEQIITKLRKKNYGFRTLVHEVVQSRMFLNK